MSRKADLNRRHVKRAWNILLRQGPKAFVNKIKIKLSERRTPQRVVSRETVISYSELDAMNDLQVTEADYFLAVQLHLYYEDLTEEFCEELSHIPTNFDLYVSVKKGLSDSKIAVLDKKFNEISNLKKCVIRRTENRGRDIAPLYVLFGDELKKYKYILHMHSKKSLYTGTEQIGWR